MLEAPSGHRHTQQPWGLFSVLEQSRARPCQNGTRAVGLWEPVGPGVWLTDVLSDHNVESCCLVIKVITFTLIHGDDVP